MLTIFKTENGILTEEEEITSGVWIDLQDPTMEETSRLSRHFDIDLVDIRAALDDEEASRVDLEDGYTLILVDIPFEEERNDRKAYSTIPLGIIIVKDAIITVCSEENDVMKVFRKNRVRSLSTKKRMRFVYQVLFRTASVYQNYLRIIDRRRSNIETRIMDDSTENSDLMDLHELETNLVYFATSLSANNMVLDRLTRYDRIEQYPEDKELLEDVMVENRQAIEMTNIYRDILHGTRELVSTLINNRMNDIMKILTSITLVMAIPTVVSGLYGMNVNGKGMPLSGTPFGFAIISFVTLAICCIVMWILHKRQML